MHIREYMKKYNETFTTMAYKLGIGAPHLQEIARNNRKPSRKLSIKIRDYSNGEITLEELLTPEECGVIFKLDPRGSSRKKKDSSNESS